MIAIPWVLVGMQRDPQPPDMRFISDDGSVQFAAVLACPCGHSLWTTEEVRAHWQQGHFDVHLYKNDQTGEYSTNPPRDATSAHPKTDERTESK